MVSNQRSTLQTHAATVEISTVSTLFSNFHSANLTHPVSGPAPFDEDDWTLIQIGDHKYHVSCRTTRCTLPTNDPNTGILSTKVQPEPQKWLLANRKIDAGNKVGCLGMQMVPTKEAIGSVIRVGDVVKVLKRGHHLYVQNADPEFQRPVL